MDKQRAIGLSMATITALSWSILAIALKYSLHFANSGTIVWVRLSVAAICLILIFGVKSPADLKYIFKPNWLNVLAGILIAGNFYGYMKCIELTGAGNAQVMIQLAPLSLGIIGIIYFKESPSVLQFVGMLTAFVGFCFFYWDQISVAVKNIDQYLIGNLWILFAVVTWTSFAVIQKVVVKKVMPQKFNLVLYITAAIALLPIGQYSELSGISLTHGLILFALGVNTIIAYGAFAEALKRVPASQVSLIIVCNPLVTLLLLHLMERYNITWVSPEPIDWRGYVGAILVVTGVALAVALAKDNKRKSISK